MRVEPLPITDHLSFFNSFSLNHLYITNGLVTNGILLILVGGPELNPHGHECCGDCKLKKMCCKIIALYRKNHLYKSHMYYVNIKS